MMNTRLTNIYLLKRQGMSYQILVDYLHISFPYLDVSFELASIVLCMFSRYLRRLSIDIKFKVFQMKLSESIVRHYLSFLSFDLSSLYSIHLPSSSATSLSLSLISFNLFTNVYLCTVPYSRISMQYSHTRKFYVDFWTRWLAISHTRIDIDIDIDHCEYLWRQKTNPPQYV